MNADLSSPVRRRASSFSVWMIFLSTILALASPSIYATDPPKEDPEEIEIDGLAAPESIFCRLFTCGR